MIWRGKVMDGYLQYVFSHGILGGMKKKPWVQQIKGYSHYTLGSHIKADSPFSHKVKEACNLLGGKKEKERGMLEGYFHCKHWGSEKKGKPNWPHQAPSPAEYAFITKCYVECFCLIVHCTFQFTPASPTDHCSGKCWGLGRAGCKAKWTSHPWVSMIKSFLL